ncbi:MAG: MFS transporter [Cellulomonas sp.]|nr:MFS transporter [Cellulomonas sp.]
MNPSVPATTQPSMSRREVLESLSGILLGMFVSVLATSVVSSSLPRIIADLGGSQSAFTWVVTATLLTTTVSTPIWGKLADLVDRKVLIQIALGISVLSAAAAGMSQGVAELIAARAVQGIGAGGLMSLSVVLIADIISPRERGKYMGLTGAVMAVATTGGPLLGGLLTDGPGWRWNFYVGLPFAVLAFVVLQRTLHLPPVRRRRPRLDYAGALLISVGITLLLLWVTFAGSSYAWVSWRSGLLVIGSLGLLAGAVAVESRAAEPLIPLHLFTNRTFVLAVIGSASVGISMFGTSVFLAQYMQLARGRTPTESGLMTIPMMAGLFVASTLSGQVVSRTGRYKPVMLVGAVLQLIGLAGMATIHWNTSFVLVALFMAVLGAGVGMLMQNFVLAVQNTLDVREIGVGTASVTFFRTLGGAIGVSVLGAVLATRANDLIAKGLAALGVPGGSLSSGTLPDLTTLPGPVRLIVEQSFGDAIAELFLLAVPTAAIALIAVLALKELPLHHRTGLEQRAELARLTEPVPDALAATPAHGAVAPATAGPAAVEGVQRT